MDAHLIYFSDPMCSWCYGFFPVIAKIDAIYGDDLPVRLVLGGLRPGNKDVTTAEGAATIRHHWEKVHEASGQPFGESVIDRGDFVYDTDPACRAVALARRTGMREALKMLEACHTAFYARGLDVTDRGVLAGLAAELGFDHAQFRHELDDDTLNEETWRDYAISQRAGVTGFPTLIIGPNPDNTFAMVSRGYNDAGAVFSIIENWRMARAAA
jgi:putative protein-disulfide isomerase